MGAGVGGISVPQENLSPGKFFLGNDVRGTMYPRMICPPPGWIVPLEKVSGVSLALVVTLSCVLRIIFIVLVIVTLKYFFVKVLTLFMCEACIDAA